MLYGKERDPDEEWFDRREEMREQMRVDGVPEYYDVSERGDLPSL